MAMDENQPVKAEQAGSAREWAHAPIDDNTLVIFAPDHGRDGKAAVFSHGSCQVPMIMRWPNGIPAGQVCEEDRVSDKAAQKTPMRRARIVVTDPLCLMMSSRRLSPKDSKVNIWGLMMKEMNAV